MIFYLEVALARLACLSVCLLVCRATALPPPPASPEGQADPRKAIKGASAALGGVRGGLAAASPLGSGIGRGEPRAEVLQRTMCAGLLFTTPPSKEQTTTNRAS